MGALKNPRWEAFVQNLVSGESQRQAYRHAFPHSKHWKDQTVDKRASELVNKNGEVLGRYNDLQKQTADKSVMVSKDRKVTLTKFANDLKLSPTDRMKAIDLLNKMDGTYVNNVKLTGSVDMGRPLEKIDDQKLEQIADKLTGDDNHAD
ncbi:terminase [Lentilactobacillus diolivorans]|uniref:terminase n=1 Tax=Lentilactobacillus diolivorans TaxID=179838 RepID=UPI00246982E5|nr:terminase [Lentilactobacillus diolivorans]MDH5106306.1 terminase [Lentilactobacillus diolivorans]